MTKQFWQDLTERAGKTFLQGLLATLSVQGVTVLDVDWAQAAAIGGTATLVSVVTSLLSFTFGNSGTASATAAVEPAGLTTRPAGLQTPGVPDHAA